MGQFNVATVAHDLLSIGFYGCFGWGVIEPESLSTKVLTMSSVALETGCAASTFCLNAENGSSALREVHFFAVSYDRDFSTRFKNDAIYHAPLISKGHGQVGTRATFGQRLLEFSYI